jgi:hypothetical protein
MNPYLCNMKNVLFLLTICLGGLVNAQTSFTMVSDELKPLIINQQDYEYVQKIISLNPIHVHPDSMSKGFTICWSGPESTYFIYGPDNKLKKKGKITNNSFVPTKRWKGGKYILKIENEVDILMLIRK